MCFSKDPRNPHGSAHGARRREERREQRDGTTGSEERETTRQTNKKTKRSDRGKAGNRRAQSRQQGKHPDIHTTGGENVPRIYPPQASAHPISSRGERDKRRGNGTS